MIKFILLHFACLLFFSGCHFGHQNELHFESVNVEARAEDFKVPKKVFEQIETDLLVDAARMQPVYLFAPIQVILFSENNAVIKKGPVRITFPNGGGKLDLKDYITGQGSFYLSFPKEQFDALPTLEKLYFISDSPKKKIDDDEFGLGCGKFIDLKKQFESLQKIDFLKLNTTELRYLYVVSGYYIFVFKLNNQIYLSHLHVTDSRYPDTFCSSLYKQ